MGEKPIEDKGHSDTKLRAEEEGLIKTFSREAAKFPKSPPEKANDFFVSKFLWGEPWEALWLCVKNVFKNPLHNFAPTCRDCVIPRSMGTVASCETDFTKLFSPHTERLNDRG